LGPAFVLLVLVLLGLLLLMLMDLLWLLLSCLGVAAAVDICSFVHYADDIALTSTRLKTCYFN